MPPINVGLLVPQTVMAVDIQTSNSTLNWRGEGTAFFWRGKLWTGKCEVKPHVSQLLFKIIVHTWKKRDLDLTLHGVQGISYIRHCVIKTICS